MFRSLSDFYTVWQYESDSTLKTLELLTDESLAIAIYPEGRTIGRLANHLIETLTEMPKRMGLPLVEESPAHTSVTDLIEDYSKKSEELIVAIKATWTDENLPEMKDMYGESWSIASSLHALILHQTHHRGQMTMMMRHVGLRVPGIYGPAREDWALMGMEPLK